MDFKLEGETYGKAVSVADGFWIIGTRHRPGLSKQMFEINNRCLVFRLKDTGGAHVLLVANAVDPAQALDEVRRLERETGLRVRYILSVGGGRRIRIRRCHLLQCTTRRVAQGPLAPPHALWYS